MRTYSSLSTPGSPALAFPPHSYVLGHQNIGTDASVAESTAIIIPIRVKSYETPAAKMPVNVQPTGTIQEPSTAAVFGGNVAMHGTREIAKLTMEGEIDTPTASVSDKELPSVYINSSNNRVTYGELVALYLDGQLNINAQGIWVAENPLWFRDPFGRVYNNPRVLDYSASLVEAVPGRTTFNLVMKV